MNHEDDETGPGPYRLHLVARIAAEPHALAAWNEDTQHPRLADAYTVLLEHVQPRAAGLATTLVRQSPQDRAAVTRLVQEKTREAAEITFEPSRLKWLLAGRRERLDNDGLPGYEAHRDEEQEEHARLEDLLHRVLRTLC